MDHCDKSTALNRSEFENEKIFDEARHNLATHIMSNGVELIIASDNKIKNMEKSRTTLNKIFSDFSHQPKPILITQTHQKPLTLSPSTLKNQMMILTLPLNNQDKLIIPNNDSSFVTKICLTTYTYRTTFVKNGVTHVESKKMVITNSLTEERKYSHFISDVTFSETPELVVGVFPTTYHFYNTWDKDQESLPLVTSSKFTITNTITGPDLHISEGFLPAYYTNTYVSRILLTRTLYDDGLQGPLTTVTSENYLTQVIITETPFFPTKDQQIIRPTSINSIDDYNKIIESFPVGFSTRIIKNVVTDSAVETLTQPDDSLALSSKHKINENASFSNQITYFNESNGYLNTEINTLYTTSASSLKLPKDIRISHTLSSEKAAQLSTKVNNNNNQYNPEIKPSKLYNNFLSSHSKIISTLNLYRLRPMLTVVAQLLKKQLVNIGETSLREKLLKTSSTNISQMLSQNTLYYIPLKQTRQDKSEGEQHLNVTKRRRENMNKLRINSLHIEPPKLHMITSKNRPPSFPKLPSVPRQHFLEVFPNITYENGLLNTGIPIRPGEVITASADVIFGRPTNLNDHITRAQIFSGYHSTLSNRFLTTFKPSIPFLDLRTNTIRNDMVLKPPPIPLHKQKLRSPEQIRFLPIDQSTDPYASPKSNTAFYSNQILDIFRIPQIFSTRIQDTNNYDTYYFTSFPSKSDQEPLKPTLSTLLQQINLGNDVLSHTINMHAAPITFKREIENNAHPTAIRGHHMKSFETPLLAPKNYEVVTLKSKDLAFKATDLKYETKASNWRRPENIKKGTGTAKYTPSFSIQKEHFSKKENSGIGHGNYYEHSAEYDQNADYSHDSLHLINSKPKKRNEFLENKPILNEWISIATNVSKRNLLKTKPSKLIIINSSYNQQQIRPSSQNADYIIGSSMVTPEKRKPYKASGEFTHFTILSHIKEIKPINSTSSKEVELQTSLVKTLDISQQDLKLKPVSNTASLRSTKELFIWNAQIMPSLNKIISLKTSLQKTFKILEPSENLQDDIYTLSRKSALNLMVTTRAKSTSNFINYYNILKPTKTKSIDNTLILKPTTTKSIVANQDSKNNVLNTDNTNNKMSINNNSRNSKYNNNTITKDDNNQVFKISSIQISRDKTDELKEVGNSLKERVLSENVTLKKNSEYIPHDSDFITELGTITGIVTYKINSSTNIDITETENKQDFTATTKMYSNWSLPFKDFNNFTIAKSNLEAFVINYPAKAANYLQKKFDNDCRPSCKANKNEICVIVTNNGSKLEESQCVCRPSFGRMFPDRPCKPTYTYEMQMETNFDGNHSLRLSDILKSNTRLLDAADRMLMQSDLRDIYHNVQLKAVISTEGNNTLIVQYILQLSENSNENQLKSSFQKYLRQSNFSIGNTGLYSSKNGLDLLAIRDFDECMSANYNDCSVNAFCFNLIGSYTCSCKNGHIDISDNALYPGRICSDNTIGCDKCNYHGKCIITEKKKVECKCHSWYAGTNCQVNLKIIAILIIISGTILTLFLLFYFLLIHTSRQRNETLIKANTLHSSMITSMESHINETISQSSHGSSLTLKKCHGVKAIPIRNMYDILNIRKAIDNPVISIRDHDKSYQTDSSIALMIPRAKYCWPYISSQPPHHRINDNQDNNRSLPDITWKSVIHKHGLTMSPRRSQGNYSKRFVDTGIQHNQIQTTPVSAGLEAMNAPNILMSEDVGSEETMDITEANTMTERDLGSTFLLPHTHLYKADQIPFNFSGMESST